MPIRETRILYELPSEVRGRVNAQPTPEDIRLALLDASECLVSLGLEEGKTSCGFYAVDFENSPIIRVSRRGEKPVILDATPIHELLVRYNSERCRLCSHRGKYTFDKGNRLEYCGREEMVNVHEECVSLHIGYREVEIKNGLSAKVREHLHSTCYDSTSSLPSVCQISAKISDEAKRQRQASSTKPVIINR